MDKGRIKQILPFALLILLGGIHSAYAEDAPPAPLGAQATTAENTSQQVINQALNVASPQNSQGLPTALPPGVPSPNAAQVTEAPTASPAAVSENLQPVPTASSADSNVSQFQQVVSNSTPTEPAPLGQPAPQGPLTANGQPIEGQAIVKHRSHRNGLVSSPPMTYQQSQQAMLDSVPNPEASMGGADPDSDTAFNALLQQNMPLNPQQVIKLRQLIDQSQRAASTPPTVPPKPVSSTIMMNLAPGATPPAIRLAQGYVTSLVFVDSTGAPWPIAAYEIGDPKTTNIQWDGKSNVLLLQAAAPYGDSDLVIRLAGLMTPLTVELVSGQRVVDFRTDIHVAGIGPNAKDVPLGTGLPNSANQLLLSVLDGIAPPGSKLLTVVGGDCQGWLLGDKMYLRTRLTVLSPGWVGRMVSPDGMNAYEIQRTSSVLVSQYGEPIELKIEGL